MLNLLYPKKLYDATLQKRVPPGTTPSYRRITYTLKKSVEEDTEELCTARRAVALPLTSTARRANNHP